ncbi:MAG: 23S rRNA (uracil(1939)-C(5))-methyltransferase RlmD [Verrucomicrobia bacterium]|nr:23S rRNA (uracil(1939)-C(5))-methyltransferase RlmD [Verrucomicrobiota bacterium]
MKPFFTQTVLIEKLSPKGFGTGFIQKTETSPKTKVIVPMTLPGEEVVAELGPKRQKSYIGRLLQITDSSPLRVPLRCQHASVCGGCSLQQMDYSAQLSYKESGIEELFSFVPKGVFFPIVPANSPWNYRNKMEYTFSQDKEKNRYLGLMKVGAKGRVETIIECHLCPGWFNQVLEKVRAWWEKTDLLAYHPFTDSGSLRTLTIREGRNTRDKMVILTVSGRPEFSLTKEMLNSFVESLKPLFSEDSLQKVSLFLRIQQAIPGKVTQFYEMKLLGVDHIQEELTITVRDYIKKYRFIISPTAFFQPNTNQAEKIYSKALEIAGIKKRKWVLDLYAGTSTLGIIFAPFAEAVVSVELNPYAVFDAKSNKEINAVENLQVLQGDVAEVLTNIQKQDPSIQHPDLILVDPPRTGLGKEALQVILSLKPKEILYISCSPTSQAEDCIKLVEAGYQIIAIQPVDQFSHTIHVENIVLLQEKSCFFP